MYYLKKKKEKNIYQGRPKKGRLIKKIIRYYSKNYLFIIKNLHDRFIYFFYNILNRLSFIIYKNINIYIFIIFIILFINFFYFFSLKQYNYLFLVVILFIIVLSLITVNFTISNKELNVDEKFIYLNMFILIFNFLNIFFNILRYVFQDIVIYFRQLFSVIYLIENKDLNFLFDNIVPIVAFESCWILLTALFSLYMFFFIYDWFVIKFLNLDSEKIDKIEMKYPEDFHNVWAVKYENFIIFCMCLWGFLMFFIGINTKFKFVVVSTNIGLILGSLAFLSLIIIVLFFFQSYYKIIQFYKKK